MGATFEPANLLEIALKKAAEDPASRQLFFRELLDSKVVIVPAGEKPRIVNGVIPQNSKISFANVEYGGRTWVPFFYSEVHQP